MTFEDFWKRLIAVEERVGANSVEFEGFQLYPLLRVRIFYALTTELGLFDAPHPNAAKEKAEIEPLTSYDSFEKSKVVVLPFRRQVGGTDPYSDRVIELLATKSSKLPGAGDSLSVLDFSSVDRLRAGFFERWGHEAMTTLKGKNMAKFAPKWAVIINALESEFQVSLEKFAKYPPMPLRLAWIESKGFAEYFKAVGAKHLYIVNAYSEQSIVLGAKLAGVKVHEIQHGFVTSMHPAYAYPGKKKAKLDHAPDSLLTWGSFWADGVPLPKGTDAIVTGPTKAFAEYREKVSREDRIIPKQVLFTSQGAVATALLTSALATAKALPDHNVIYRLHPNETLEDYATLAASLGAKTLPKNFSFSHKDPIFLDLVSQSEYLVGAFSTTLYEGLALGCKVLVLPLPGYEHVKRAIDLGDMTLVSSLDELPKFLPQARQASDPKRYYA